MHRVRGIWRSVRDPGGAGRGERTEEQDQVKRPWLRPRGPS